MRKCANWKCLDTVRPLDSLVQRHWMTEDEMPLILLITKIYIYTKFECKRAVSCICEPLGSLTPSAFSGRPAQTVFKISLSSPLFESAPCKVCTRYARSCDDFIAAKLYVEVASELKLTHQWWSGLESFHYPCSEVRCGNKPVSVINIYPSTKSHSKMTFGQST